jgi:ABC-type transporter Mla subunit MlaD
MTDPLTPEQINAMLAQQRIEQVGEAFAAAFSGLAAETEKATMSFKGLTAAFARMSDDEIQRIRRLPPRT